MSAFLPAAQLTHQLMVASVNGVYGPHAPKDAVQADNLGPGVVTNRFLTMAEATAKEPFWKHKTVILMFVQVSRIQ